LWSLIGRITLEMVMEVTVDLPVLVGVVHSEELTA
jgi:hypothetical protein